MAKQPSAEMTARLRALCKSITVAEDIDPGIQEELLGHMEDKFCAYLDGTEPVTEEDALILVREHFGDPAQVKALLQNTHQREAGISLGRRLAAAASATLVCYIAMKLTITIGTILLMWWATANEHVAFVLGYVNTSFRALLTVGTAAAVCYAVYRWRKQIDHGARPWFMTWSPWRLSYTVAALTLTLFLVPTIGIGTTGLDMGIQTSSASNLAFLVLIMGISAIALLAQSIAWLWWCDRPPRTTRTLSHTTLAWILVTACSVVPVTTVLVTTRIVNPGSTVTISNNAMNGQLELFTLATGQEQFTASLQLLASLTGAVTALLPAIILLAATGWIARGIYAIKKRQQNKSHTTPIPS